MKQLSRFNLEMLFLFAAAASGVAHAQEYPNKPVRFITSAVGSNSDFHARMLAQGLAGPLGQPVVVENRGSGVATTQAAAKMPPDGYNLLVDSNSIWMTTLLQKTSYDALKDFSTISLVSRSPYVLVVHPSLPVGSIKELVSLAKAKPGQLNFSSGSPGTASHLAAELFKSLAGVNIIGISYASNSHEISDLISGQVQLTFWGGTKAIPLAKAGKVRLLAITSTEPSPLFPGLAPIASSGVPGYEWVQSVVLLAPAKTPETIVQRLNRETVRFLSQADVKRKMLDAGVDPAGSSPEELTAAIKSSMAKMDKVLKSANIRIDSN